MIQSRRHSRSKSATVQFKAAASIAIVSSDGLDTTHSTLQMNRSDTPEHIAKS